MDTAAKKLDHILERERIYRGKHFQTTYSAWQHVTEEEKIVFDADFSSCRLPQLRFQIASDIRDPSKYMDSIPVETVYGGVASHRYMSLKRLTDY